MSTKTIIVVCLIVFAVVMMLIGSGIRDNTAGTVFVWILALLAVFLLPKSDGDTEENKR